MLENIDFYPDNTSIPNRVLSVTNSNCLAPVLSVNCNIVPSTLNVNPSLFVILCVFTLILGGKGGGEYSFRVLQLLSHPNINHS